MHYTDTHEWIEIQGDEGTVGITSYAQQELGSIVYVQLPKVGQRISAGEEVSVLESTKSAADVYSPVSGVITHVNESILQSPEKINQNAETTGWLFKIKLSNLSEIKSLLSLAEYRAILG